MHRLDADRRVLHVDEQEVETGGREELRHVDVRHRDQATDDRLAGAEPFLEWVDRKSVVEGTSVSVRVDLGGRRIIKTKIIKTRHAMYEQIINNLVTSP